MSSKAPFGMPHRDTVTGLQVTTLLSAINVLQNFLLNPTRDTADGWKNPELDGGVRSSIEASVIRICDRLDIIIGDETRWSLDLQNILEEQLMQLNEKAAELADLQIAANKEILTPHFRYKPTILRLTDGNWAVMLGEVEQPGAIVGFGATINDAIANFDDQFSGPMDSEIVAWLAIRQQAIADGKLPPPMPKPKAKQNETQQQTVDEIGHTDGNNDAESIGENPKTNRNRPRKKRKSNRKKGRPTQGGENIIGDSGSPGS